MQDPEVTTEPVIGRRVSAKRAPPSPLRRQIDSLANRLDLTKMRKRPVKIEVSDVDWNTPDTIVVDDSALKKIARHYYPPEPIDDPLYFETKAFPDGGVAGSTSNLQDLHSIIDSLDDDEVLRVAKDPDGLEE